MGEAVFSELLKQVSSFFVPQPDKPEETPESTLRALWLCACGTPTAVTRVQGKELPPLGPSQQSALGSLVDRRRSGVPLAHLTQRQEFLGMELLAGPEALIPRRETEILGRSALEKLHEMAATLPAVSAIDVCTGSGNLALAYVFHEPKVRVFAADLSEDAVRLAKRNSDFLGLSGRVQFHVGDLFAPLETLGLHGKCDLVSCNPPYISTSKVSQMHHEISAHEPSAAFDGGPYGVSILMRLMKDAPRFLKPGGALCFEVGLGQGASIERQLSRQPWVSRVETHLDGQNAVRALVATCRT